MTRLKRWIPEICIFALLLTCYVYFFPRWADWNQNSRLNMVLAVVDDGTFQIDKYVENTGDYAKIGDHYYSDKAPGVAFLGIPVYAALRPMFHLPAMQTLMARLEANEAVAQTLREDGSGLLEHKVRFAIALVAVAFVTAALPSAITGVLLYRLAHRMTHSVLAGSLVALSYGLLTPAFAYANAFFGHQLCAALLLGSFALVISGSNASIKKGALVGALLGYSVLTEYPAALGVLCIVAYCVLVRPNVRFLLALGLSLALFGVILGVYNNHIFGSPFSLGYAHSTLYMEQHETGFFSLVGPQPDALWGLTFGLYRGIFVLSPWLLLALPGALFWWRRRGRRRELFLMLGIFLSFFMFNASSIMWWGGWSVGPRYILPGLPFLALLTTDAIKPSRPFAAFLLTVLLLWSLVATWGLSLAGQLYPPDTFRNPLLEYAWPHITRGDVARNVGTLLGLPGWWSLLPLLSALGLLALIWLLASRGYGQHDPMIQPSGQLVRREAGR